MRPKQVLNKYQVLFESCDLWWTGYPLEILVLFNVLGRAANSRCEYSRHNIRAMDPLPAPDSSFLGATVPNGAHQIFNGRVAEQEILQWYFHTRGIRAHAVCTDQFIEKSKAAYGVEWLAREIPQNFVDHNPVYPGTLNGVDFSEQQLGPNKVRFTTTGHWDFNDATALLSLHSEKPEGHQSAGGNGIGIKQAALLLLRDYAVDRFEIQGNGWNVNYRIITAQEINTALVAANHLEHSVRNNWLIGEITACEPRAEHNSYIVETDHPLLINNLRQMPLLGVSDSHPALQDMDFKSSAGSLKWVLPESGEKLDRGVLFLNGQIMNAQDKGESGDDYWHGPYGLTVQLNQVEYEMSMDRPPVTTTQFRNYIEVLTEEMSPQDIIDQLRRSEPLWSVTASANDPDSSQDYSPESHFECHTLLSKLVTKLQWSSPRYSYDNFSVDFPERKYVVRDFGNPSDAQMEQLRANGYILLPRYFNKLGIPSVSTLFKSEDKSLPSNVEESRLRMAKNNGIEVSFATLQETGPASLAKELIQLQFTKKDIGQASPDEISLTFPIQIDGELLAHPLPNPKSDQQNFLSTIRSIIFHLLDTGVAQGVNSNHPVYNSTYSLGHDTTLNESTLQTRISDGHDTTPGFTLTIKLAAHSGDEFLKALLGNAKATKQAPLEDDSTDITGEVKPRKQHDWKQTLKISGGVAVVAGLVIGVPAIVKKIDWSGLNLGTNPARSRPTNNGTGSFGAGSGLRTRAVPPTNYSQLSRRFDIRSPNSFEDILAQNDHTNIRPGSYRGESSGFDSHSPDDPEMNFKVIQNPSPAQLERLRILLTYFELCTNLEVRNNLFIYEGDGSKGLNIGGNALGINVKIIDAEFDEAMTTWAHEVAHNRSSGHGLDWETLRSSEDAALRRKQAEIIMKQRDQIPLTPEEIFIRDARDLWNATR